MASEGYSQTEIWDDSELLDSWNAAFEEYKKYHSLAVQGQKVPMEHMKEIATPISQVLEQNDAVEAAAEAKGDDLEDSPPRPLKGSIPHAPPHEAISSSVPRALTASINDEGLKNVMMSWYYAGYYTGLLEGKQQGHAAAMQQRSS